MKHITNFILEGLRINKDTKIDKFKPEDDVERMAYFAKETLFKGIDLTDKDFKEDRGFVYISKFNDDPKLAKEFFDKRAGYLHSTLHSSSSPTQYIIRLGLNSKAEVKYKCAGDITFSIALNENKDKIEEICCSKLLKDILINI